MKPIARVWFIATFAAAVCVLLPHMAAGQTLTGTLIGTARDEQGAAIPSGQVRISSSALIGGPRIMLTSEGGQFRFPNLPPGPYMLDIEVPGFASYHEEDIRIGASTTLERTVVLKVKGVAESIVVEGSGSRLEARDSGFDTHFGAEYLRAIPTRRYSMYDWLRATPGVSPTSASSGNPSFNTVSAFGSGVSENMFLIDGTNFTCPCQGVSRAEPGVDVIQEIQVQGVGASAEFGNIQGAVVNVVTRQGGNRFAYDTSYYGQPSSLTSQPVLVSGSGSQAPTGYERIKYRDFTTNLGGPVYRDRLWFFTGYQYLRDYDSQPGADPKFPRTYEQNKVFGKLTWQLTPRLQLVQSFHEELWTNPQVPTLAIPFAATERQHAHVPAMTFGHLTHTLSANTLWDVRVGRFVYTRGDDPSSGSWTTPNRFDSSTKINSGAPQQIGGLKLIRTTAKATLSHYQRDFLGANHAWKLGTEVEKGEHTQAVIIPTGIRYVDNNGLPFQTISRPPAINGGQFISTALFATDAFTIGHRLTVNAGVRFDHSRAISPDLHAIDLDRRETGEIVRGLGTLYTWNLVSPRLGVTTKLSSDSRTILRASYGRFHQGVLTGEGSQVHPGLTPLTTMQFDPLKGGYTTLVSVVDPSNLLVDPHTRSPRTDEYSIGVDRELGGRLSASVAYIHKSGRDYIGWTDVGGQYRDDTQTLQDGRIVPVRVLVNSTADRRFLLTNPDGYFVRYDGLVIAAEKRPFKGWEMFGSYTYSRVYGLQSDSGTTPGGSQLSTVANATPITFGQDPNDLTNARGRLPNDRPHVFRMMGKVDVPRTGVSIAANFQYFSGKPWAATTLVSLPQNKQQRILLEPRGSRRLSSPSLLDVRLSKRIFSRESARVEVLVDVLNVLNETAEEELATDDLFSRNFGRPTILTDPRRAMVGVRLNLGRP
jgi:hypothetical protein